MKRLIKASEGQWTPVTNKNLVELLKANGIDTTKARYELKAIQYERYSGGPRYTRRFTCLGDWLAYYSMLLHKCPNAASFNEQGYTLEDIEDEIAEGNTTLDAMKDNASRNWWGDGDDYIISLRNLDTGDYLYGPEEEYTEEEDED